MAVTPATGIAVAALAQSPSPTPVPRSPTATAPQQTAPAPQALGAQLHAPVDNVAAAATPNVPPVQLPAPPPVQLPAISDLPARLPNAGGDPRPEGLLAAGLGLASLLTGLLLRRRAGRRPPAR